MDASVIEADARRFQRVEGGETIDWTDGQRASRPVREYLAAGLVPMIADIDIYRSANELIKQHGDAADIEAAMRADELMEAGDMDGRAVWLRIVKAVEELQSEERPEDAKVH